MRRILNQIGGGQALIYIFLIVAITMMLTMLIASKTVKLSREKKKFFIYILIQCLFFVLFASILYNLKDTTLSQRFVSLQCYFTLVGSIHLGVFHFYFDKFESKRIHTEIFISFISAFYISAFIVAIADFFGEFDYIFYLVSSLLFFTIPTFCFILFETAISVPAKLHKRWFYPLNTKYPNPQASEMRNIIILNLVFQKKANDKQIINFKVKAPKAFEYGRLFYYFINDYNEKNPNGQIKFLDDNQQPYGWYFHTKPKWFGSAQYIDPEIAIDTNNIKDGATIICQRI
jgi:hypothetical protein